MLFFLMDSHPSQSHPSQSHPRAQCEPHIQAIQAPGHYQEQCARETENKVIEETE
jgi:hypothetical protein